MRFKPGDIHYTSRGIIEVESNYREEGLNKVRVWLHQVHKDDGVSPNGQTVLMSAPPEDIKQWVQAFSINQTERRMALGSMKNKPGMRKFAETMLNNIALAEHQEPKIRKRGRLKQ